MGQVEYRVADGIAVISLERSEKLNALSSAMWDEYRACMAQFAADDAARVLILRGSGRAFCVGRDMAEDAAKGEPPPAEYDENFNIFGVADTDKPIIAAVQGYAIGAGWYMVAGCDIRIAATGTRFAMTEVRTGLLGPYFLSAAETLPWPKAYEYAVLGRHVDASELRALGLLNEVVDPSDLDARAQQWAEELLCLPPVHVRQTKRLMREQRGVPSPELMEREREARVYLDGLGDTREAVQAFAEKRDPVFRGA